MKTLLSLLFSLLIVAVCVLCLVSVIQTGNPLAWMSHLDCLLHVGDAGVCLSGMLVTIRFTRRIGDGLFGRLAYEEIVCPDIEVNNLDHALNKVRVTCLKHKCLYNVNKAFLPRAYIQLPDNTIVSTYVNRDGTIEIERMTE
jgi:hypothetical protein